jgi:O-6-methylguanine DNA methyltransferase
MRLSTRQDNAGGAQAIGSVPAEARFRTPWGEGLVAVWRGRLAGVELPPVRGGRTGESEDAIASSDQDAARRWAADLEAYFRGERLSWRADEVELDTEGMTRFCRSTIEALLTVPAGSTVSYGDLARSAGPPPAARAVGSVMAANPIPIVVPCHRVIRSDGNLGRYGTDASWKERLLAHERLNSGGG